MSRVSWIGLRRSAIAAIAIALVAVGGPPVYRFFVPSDGWPPCAPSGALECTTVDGLYLGHESPDCSATTAAEPTGSPDFCAQRTRAAVAALDNREPQHPAVVTSATYDWDMARVCGPRRCVFSGGHSIVVFTLNDGSHRAIAYDCMVGGCGANPGPSSRP